MLTQHCLTSASLIACSQAVDRAVSLAPPRTHQGLAAITALVLTDDLRKGAPPARGVHLCTGPRSTVPGAAALRRDRLGRAGPCAEGPWPDSARLTQTVRHTPAQPKPVPWPGKQHSRRFALWPPGGLNFIEGAFYCLCVRVGRVGIASAGSGPHRHL